MLQPPTDNLYKFAAVLGLVVICSSVALEWRYRLQIQERVSAEVAEQGRLIALYEPYAKEVNAMQDAIAHADPSEVAELKAKLRERLPALEAMKKPLDEYMQGHFARTVSLAHAQQNYKRVRIAYWCGLVLGAALAIYGFVFWYKRVQAPLDRKARRS